MKHKLYIIIALLMTARVALASRPCAIDTVVKVISPCNAGRELTIRIPVRLPAGITAEYEWFRNGMAIPETRRAGFGGGIIAYTIPAHSVVSGGQEFYFLFRLSDDDCDDCWDSSPLYVISWKDSVDDISCKISGGAINGSELTFCGANAGGAIQGENVQVCDALNGGIVQGEEVQHCGADAGGEIGSEAVQHCNANAGGVIGGSEVQHCGAGAGGVIGN